MNTVDQRSRTWALLWVMLLIIVVIRLPFFLGEVMGEDAPYHARAALAVLDGGLLYRDVPFTYPPLYAYTQAFAIALLGNTAIGWKAVAQAYDLGSIVLIWLIVSRSFGQRRGLFSAALQAISPLPLLATSSFVSFDSAAAFWMLASILFVLRGTTMPSAVALAIGTGYKYFPILLLPPILKHLSLTRERVSYSVAVAATVALIQLPFWLSDFPSWFANVVSYHVDRPALGGSIYNLLRPAPTLSEVPESPLLLLFPTSILLTFILVFLDGDKSERGLLTNCSLVMVVGVVFSKVVVWYALWFIPLLSIWFGIQDNRNRTVLLIPFLTLQVSVLLASAFHLTGKAQAALAMAYLYLLMCGVFLAWLLRDRLRSTMNTWP